MRRARRRQRARRTLWPSAVALQPAWLDVTSFSRLHAAAQTHRCVRSPAASYLSPAATALTPAVPAHTAQERSSQPDPRAAMQRGRIARSARWLRRYLRRNELFGAR